jgi:hypothetical protein
MLLHFIVFVFLFNFDPHFLLLFSYHFLDLSFFFPSTFYFILFFYPILVLILSIIYFLIIFLIYFVFRFSS